MTWSMLLQGLQSGLSCPHGYMKSHIGPSIFSIDAHIATSAALADELLYSGDLPLAAENGSDLLLSGVETWEGGPLCPSASSVLA